MYIHTSWILWHGYTHTESSTHTQSHPHTLIYICMYLEYIKLQVLCESMYRHITKFALIKSLGGRNALAKISFPFGFILIVIIQIYSIWNFYPTYNKANYGYYTYTHKSATVACSLQDKNLSQILSGWTWLLYSLLYLTSKPPLSIFYWIFSYYISYTLGTIG